VFVALIVLLAALASAQTTVSGTLGTGVSVAASTATTINYGGGTTIVTITTDAATTVTFGLVIDTSFSLDATLSQYTLGSLASAAANIGYSLSLSNNANIVSCTVTSDTLGTAFLASLTGKVAGVLYYDVSAQGYLEIPPTITVAKAQFSAPYQGKYVFVVRASTQPAAALFSKAVSISANAASQIQLQSTTTSKLVITQTTTADSSFTATESSSAPAGVSGSAKGLVRISSFFDLQSSVNTGISSNLQYSYTAADEAKVAVSTLAWYYYNTATSSWDVDGTSSVDVNARVVTHASTHFSAWMVAATSFSVAALPAALFIAIAVIMTLLA